MYMQPGKGYCTKTSTYQWLRRHFLGLLMATTLYGYSRSFPPAAEILYQWTGNPRELGKEIPSLSCQGWDIGSEYSETLTHPPLDKMAAISQTIFSDAFSWMKSLLFWSKFHWSLFLIVQWTLTQHWAYSAPSHYLNQCWPDSLMHICGTRGRWVNKIAYILQMTFLNAFSDWKW